MSEETQVEEKKLISDEEQEAMNRKIAAATGAYLRALASLSDEEIYEMKFTKEGGVGSPVLLRIVSEAFTAMLEVAGDLPCGHFDSYKNVVADFNNSVVFHIDSKLESNRDALIAVVKGKVKEPERVSYNDISNALTKE